MVSQHILFSLIFRATDCLQNKKRLPSNLRLNTHECVHLVTCGYFQLRDKGGSHTIRPAIARNPIVHAKFMALFY